MRKTLFWIKKCLPYTLLFFSLTQPLAAQPVRVGADAAPSSSRSQAQQLFQQGLQARAAGQMQNAVDYWEQALSLYEAPENRAQTLGNLAVAYYETGQYIQAMDSNQSAIALFTQLNQMGAIGQVHSNLGNVHEALGQYDEAIAAYRESIRIAQATGQQQSEGISTGNLGYVYSVQGNQAAALAEYQKSLKIDREIGDRLGEGHRLLNIGIANHELEEAPLAIQHYQASLAIAKAVGNRPLEAKSLINLGIAVAEKGAYDEAIAYLNQSLGISKTLNDPNLIARTYNNLGHTLLAANRLDEAEAQLRESIAQLDSLRQNLEDSFNVSIFDTQIYTYNLLTQILVASGQSEAALETAEAGRARAFVDLLQKRSDPIDSDNLDQLVAAAPSLEEIKQIARQNNATLVEYALVPEDSFRVHGRQRGRTAEIHTWIVSPDGRVDFHHQPIDPQSQQLTALVEQVRDSVGARTRGFAPAGADSADDTTHLNQLYQLLIEPIEGYLPTGPEAEIVFIPQEELFSVPFAALVRNDGDYLIEHHTVRSAPSIQTLSFARSRHQQLNALSADSRQPPLIVGNPEMPEVWDPQIGASHKLPLLPGAKQEATEISKLFDVAPLTGQDASEKVVRSRIETASIVHLATHGLLDYGNPKETGVNDLPGAIALTADQAEDGLLTSAEILELNLQADLVVLSACDTGLGTITGDGVIGLSRSLIAAGTPSVIVSLWSVPDMPTATLMVEFYSQIHQGQRKAQALRQAMLTTMKAHPEPSNWAAFTLIGETN